MKTDLYTKVILTVIALCLTLNVVKDFDIIPSAYAFNGSPETNPLLAPLSETIDVRIVDINTYDELNVNINSIDTTDELDINIDEIGGGWVNNGGPIKVKVD